jgi:hypothetical protein
MIPQLVGVEELPGRSGLVINLIDDCDGRCTRFILRCVLSNYCFKHSPKDKGLSDRVRYVVDVVQKSGGEIRKLMVCRRGDDAIDGSAERCGSRWSRILNCELGQSDVMWRGLK